MFSGPLKYCILRGVGEKVTGERPESATGLWTSEGETNASRTGPRRNDSCEREIARRRGENAIQGRVGKGTPLRQNPGV